MFFGLRKREEREGEVKLSPSKSGQVDDLVYLHSFFGVIEFCIISLNRN